MSVKLRMLGTGDAFSTRYMNNNALWSDGTFNLLVDCGRTAPAVLKKLGIGFGEIDAVLITHLHKDHTGGLAALVKQRKADGLPPMPLLVPPILSRQLWDEVLAPELTPEDGTGLGEVFEVRIVEPGAVYRLSGGLAIELLRTNHVPGKPSFSLLVNGFIFYSADMVFDPGLLTRLVGDRGVRVILHECQLSGKGAVHTELSQLLSLPEAIRRRILLMHYGDEQPEFEGRTGEMQFLRQHTEYEWQEPLS